MALFCTLCVTQWTHCCALLEDAAMKAVGLLMALALPLIGWSKTCESDDPAGVLTQGTKPNIHPGVHFVEPPYAGFDPCHDTVDLKINEKSTTWVLVLHGGAGLDDPARGIGRRFQQAGYSVLMFDAFKMNKINKDGIFWATSVHASSTGRMLYFSGLAAIKWVRRNHPDRSQNVIVYGISTGGIAAANLAATEGLDALRMVFAEGPNNAGIGFPSRILKPVHVFYGAQDNFGGSSEQEFLWKRRSSCLWNAPIYNMPVGNAEGCNYTTWTRTERGQTVEEWVDEQKAQGAEVTFRLIEGASHAIFNGKDITSTVRATPSGIKLYWTTGAKPGVADKLFGEILATSQK